ncbi:MAG: site-specific integrase, partial [Candidatus Zixiibacteriota bacterium]
MEIQKRLDDFLHHLRLSRGLSQNTLESYRLDLKKYFNYLKKKKISDFRAVRPENISEFIYTLYRKKLKSTSISRNLSAIKSFHSFLLNEDYSDSNPAETIDSPKIGKRLPQTLTPDEMKKILEQPFAENDLGKRDKAILEFLYATGVRISELLNFKREGFLPEVSLVRIIGKGNKERFVPIGKKGIKAIRKYLKYSRPNLAKDYSEDIMFLG